MFPKAPISFSKVGGRTENQDCAYPTTDAISKTDQLFVVCDGVGGAAGGAIASGIACKRFPIHLSNISDNPTKDDFEKALDHVSKDMRNYAKGDPTAASMATTFTMAHVSSEKLTLAWCGDSRIFWVRNGKIKYHTFDHSLVGEMVARGELTWEEARIHPRSNVITRSLNAQNEAFADFKEIDRDDLEENDYILLCSDGVLEVFSNEDLEDLMDGQRSPSQIANEIDDECELRSRDNYTLILFQVGK